MKNIIPILILLSFTQHICAQSFQELVQQSIDGTRNGDYAYLSRTQFEGVEDFSGALNIIRSNLSDSVVEVRRNCYWMIKTMRDFTPSKANRVKLTALLSKGLNDQDGGIIGNTIAYLKNFERDEFSVDSRQLILNKIQTNIQHLDKLIRLAGYINHEGTIKVLKLLEQTDTISNITRWNVRLAMVRVGDPTYEDYIVNRIKRLPVDDALVYDVLPDLVYSRSAKGFSYLKELLMRESLDCRPADMEIEGRITCAYRVMELLAPVLDGFPLEIQDDQIVTQDYPNALSIAREWLGQFTDKLPINNDFY